MRKKQKQSQSGPIRKALKGRPQPSAPTLGVKKSRYTTGGKVTRKKNV